MAICAICKAEHPEETMTDFDYLTPSGEHKTELACQGCTDDMQSAGQQEREQLEQMMQVTREMAADAGDKNLEGQWIRW